MKKALLLLFMMLPLMGTLSAQQKPSSKKMVLTDKGVDILNSHTLVLNPPADAIYDAAVIYADSDDDIGGTDYKLLKQGKEIGVATLYDGELASFYIWSDNVVLDNGLKVGDNILDALSKNKVTASAFFNMMEGSIELVFRHGRVLVIASAEFSPSIQKKLQEIEDATVQSWEDGTYEMPTLELKAKDFISGGAITSFSLSIP